MTLPMIAIRSLIMKLSLVRRRCILLPLATPRTAMALFVPVTAKGTTPALSLPASFLVGSALACPPLLLGTAVLVRCCNVSVALVLFR